MRPFEQSMPNSAVPVAPTEATAPIDYPSDFVELGVPEVLVKVLAARGVSSAFPIQGATLPDSLHGHDVLGRGKTGSGKTIAFAIPLVVRLAASGLRRQAGHPRALILVPTRELANQVMTSLQPLAAAMSLRVATIYGGVGQGPQVSALRQGVDIVVACPGRLEDLIGQRHCRLDAVEITVLDEADHMADLGFLPGVKRILDATPAGGQRMLFSATLDKAIDGLVRTYLVNPVVHSVDPEVSSINTMTHHVLAVTVADKPSIISALASGLDRTLLFTRTKHGAKKIAKQLCSAGIPAVELHGNLSQSARERNLADFSNGRVRVLVATDIAARGIHVDDIALVVHVDPPAEHKSFLHRSGRTARAGAEGIVVTVMTPDQTGDVRSLARAAGITPTVTNVNSAHPLLGELSGPAAPKVAARPQTADDSVNAPRQRPSQPGRRRTQSGGRPGSPAGHPRGNGRGSGGRRSATTGR
ncbi:MAG TPA: DEAD/DEAH box helicase [Ilumatobacteraceae bacterium]|nr:DEAD/DEAH box helicase [Ilumatobacteraceae bacterium]